MYYSNCPKQNFSMTGVGLEPTTNSLLNKHSISLISLAKSFSGRLQTISGFESRRN